MKEKSDWFMNFCFSSSLAVADTERMANEVASHFGRLDILVNCVGLNREEKAGEVTEAAFDHVLDANLKSAMFQALAEATDLTRKQVTDVFVKLDEYIAEQLGKKGPGVVTVPGLLKIKKVEKPATKEREGRNPSTGQPIIIKAKPKRTVVKAYALKNLKEMAK